MKDLNKLAIIILSLSVEDRDELSRIINNVNEECRINSLASPGYEGEPEQTEFDVVLKSYQNNNKIGLVKEVKRQLHIGLKDAKILTESAPCVIKENISLFDATHIQISLEAQGAVVELK